MFWKRQIRILNLHLKRVNETHLRVGNRTSGLRVGNREPSILRIGRSKTENRLQSEMVNSRRCEPILGGNPINITHNTCAHYPVLIGLRTAERSRLLLGLRAAAKPDLRVTC